MSIGGDFDRNDWDECYGSDDDDGDDKMEDGDMERKNIVKRVKRKWMRVTTMH